MYPRMHPTTHIVLALLGLIAGKNAGPHIETWKIRKVVNQRGKTAHPLNKISKAVTKGEVLKSEKRESYESVVAPPQRVSPLAFKRELNIGTGEMASVFIIWMPKSSLTSSDVLAKTKNITLCGSMYY